MEEILYWVAYCLSTFLEFYIISKFQNPLCFCFRTADTKEYDNAGNNKSKQHDQRTHIGLCAVI